MAQVVYHRLAAREARRAERRYASVSLSLAARFRDAVDHARTRIAADPEALALVRGAYRQVRVIRFPYVLIYLILPSGIVQIVALAHTSRRPGYWRRRK